MRRDMRSNKANIFTPTTPRRLGLRAARKPRWSSSSRYSEAACEPSQPLALRATVLHLPVLLLASCTAAAQQIGQNAPPEANGTATISVSTQFVVETVVVKDKKGNPIEGLTAKDFTVTENGVPQTISFCEHQELPETPSAAPAAPSEPENIKIYDQLGRTRISPETPGKPSLPGPPPVGAVLRHDGHAARGPVARARCGAEVHPDADDSGGSRFHPEIFGRRR